jgi:teichuronic acid biosynthesis glycosyltransferase TuaC
MLRVVTLSTLFPNVIHPTFGVFVENQTLRLASCGEVELRVVNPIALPPFPFNRHLRYRELDQLMPEETWQGLRVARPPFKIIPGLSGVFNSSSLFYAARRVLRKWWNEGFAFDVIDAQFFYPDGPAAGWLASEFRVPFSIKARGADIHYWSSRVGCRRQILAAAGRANGLLSVSQSLRRDMISMGIDGGKIKVHYTGVDLDQFRPLGLDERAAAKSALGVTGPLVVSVGALIPRKGHDVVIEAMAKIDGATLLVVGEGSERPHLEDTVRRLSLAQRVRLLGNIPHARLPLVFGAADVMALASKSEGLANVWVEALACGTPIAIPEVDGAKEVLDRPEAGLLVRQRTPAAFAEAIGALLAHRPPPEAVRCCAERFNWQKNTSALYEHLVMLKTTPATPVMR